MSAAPEVLYVQGASKHFGGVQALSDVDLRIEARHIHGLIGPNGAGKTTLFNVITGLYLPDRGRFSLNGHLYRPSAVHKVTRAGIARTFQNIRLFAHMSALDNVMVARHTRTHCGPLAAILRTRAFRSEEAAIRQRATELLHYVGVAHLAHAHAHTLSYGDQRRLEIARALATEPQLLALDEPAAGMNAHEKNVLSELIHTIRRDHCSVLLIEHDVKFVMGLCDLITVLDRGKRIAHGSPAAIQSDPAVIAAYLGTRQTAAPPAP
jgi:branched-chain amino acid transport system ATP-binding protein